MRRKEKRKKKKKKQPLCRKMRTQFSDFPIFSQLMECGLKYTRSECEMGKEKENETKNETNKKKLLRKKMYFCLSR